MPPITLAKPLAPDSSLPLPLPPATEAEIAEARRRYGDDDIQVDDNALASKGDGGIWVQGWVWLPAPEPLNEECP